MFDVTSINTRSLEKKHSQIIGVIIFTCHLFVANINITEYKQVNCNKELLVVFSCTAELAILSEINQEYLSKLIYYIIYIPQI